MSVSGGTGGFVDKQSGAQSRILPGTLDLAIGVRQALTTYVFEGTLDSRIWTTTATGSGAITGAGVMTTGVTSNSTVRIDAARPGRYMAGSINVWSATLRVADTGTTNNTRRWGCFDTNNGYYFELSGTTLNIVSRKSTSNTAVAKASWDNGSLFTLDTNFHLYEIVYWANWALFYIDGILVHTLTGLVTSARTDSIQLFNRVENSNSGGSTTNVSMTIQEIAISRYGPDGQEPAYARFATAATTTLKIGPGRLRRVTVNKLATTSTATATVYDNTAGSGTIIAIVGLATAVVTLEFNTAFTTGLTVVTAGANVGDSTVVYD